MPVPSDRCRSLRILTLSGWLFWALSLAATAYYYQQRTSHPSYVPVLGLLTLQALVGLTLLALAAVRLVRGPARILAAGWLLLGTTPLWLSAAHLSHSIWMLATLQTSPPTTSIKWGSTVPACAADLIARHKHPIRTTGKHFILFHDADDRASQQIVTIDEHIEHMETLLGKKPDGTTHWVRGPVFGHGVEPGGWYNCGLAVVSQPGHEIATIDRHEIAHAVIDRHCGGESHPPSQLIEGWAESQSGYEHDLLATRAWEHRRRGEWLGLRDLTREDWYDCNGWHVYDFGGPLVDYILTTFGGPKFLELYSTCQPETFAQDIQRVLGLTIDKLDRDYWEAIERQAETALTKAAAELASVPLPDGADRTLWQQFVEQSAEHQKLADTSVEPVKVTFHAERFRNKEQQVTHTEVIHAGNRRRKILHEEDREEVSVATPDASFYLVRQGGSARWSLSEWSSETRRPADYWGSRQFIQITGWENVDGFENLRSTLQQARKSPDFRVIRFSPSNSSVEPTIQFEFASTSLQDDKPYPVQAQFTLLPGRKFAALDYKIRRSSPRGDTVEQNMFGYSTDDKTSPRPQTIHRQYESNTTKYELKSRLESYGPWVMDEKVFAPETYGVPRSAIDAYYRPPRYVWSFAAAAPLSLVGGGVLLLWARRREFALPGRSESDEFSR